MSDSGTGKSKSEEIGRVLRIWRASRKMTQADVAAQIGVSAQQYQKYETGASGIELNRLFDICRVFDKSPADLMAVRDDETAGVALSRPARQLDAAGFVGDADLASQADLSFQISELVSHFMAMRSPADRRTALLVLKALAERQD